ncbi:MAG: bifunctional methylenetetrahydrofolate dehydrogenase/methenyltetrahydrofolate cyclohydrolase FolD [Candidatus Diapherotrites archaeon]|nr:bifunctional methylenetetrahydrofolate dehydrogenase/methenyltetrahydrofolate cyclohydrolase FolD [Candidatus Diapherotrites archaeon]
MKAEIIDGRAIAEEIRMRIKEEIAGIKNSHNLQPLLAVIMLGSNPASEIYVKAKKKAADEAGILSEQYSLPESTKEDELIRLIERLNSNANTNGILVQLPLPKHINAGRIMQKIAPEKDVDGFTPENMGNLMLGNETLAPCTPLGIIKLIESAKIRLRGKNAVIVGASNIVGKPLASMLLNREATVEICHKATKNIAQHTKNADILIVAVGKKNLINKKMVKKNAVIIDVGINRLGDGKIVGDVNFDEVSKVAGYITPVPGGVGPMTVACLMKNVLEAAKMQIAEGNKNE